MDGRSILFLWWSTMLTSVDNTLGCQLSEFMCDTGYCVALDKYCNGYDDCGDKSDEPPYCSPCNRTYYGEVGRTYELEVRRPREDRLPFLCYLNFTAAGAKYGDIIQLTFDTFTVGRFVSYTSDGCPDGYMSIREWQLPDTGGQWCGSAWGFTVYYSETKSINLTLILSKLSEQGIGYNFDFKLSYKYLKKSDAHLRYGNSTLQTWRGQMIAGSYCDRILDQCDRKPCRVQSPNYPGAYPRNVTCYYRIEQRTAPKSKRALIVVRQPNAHKIHIKDQVINYDRSQRTLRNMDPSGKCFGNLDYTNIIGTTKYYVTSSGESKTLLEVYRLYDIRCVNFEQKHSFKMTCSDFWASSHRTNDPAKVELCLGFSNDTVVAAVWVDGRFDVTIRLRDGVTLSYDRDDDAIVQSRGQHTAKYFIDGTVEGAFEDALEVMYDVRGRTVMLGERGETVAWNDRGKFGLWSSDEQLILRLENPAIIAAPDYTQWYIYGDPDRLGTVFEVRTEDEASVRVLDDGTTTYKAGDEDSSSYTVDQVKYKVWDQCNVIQDYLTVYDGSLATDPVLVRLCGGDVVPDIVSSGPNMLLEFHTSAFDNPFHPVPLSYLPGFELDVEILFVDNKSPSYAKNTSQCEFFIRPYNNTNWGLLDSPRHSLPPNTSCKYHFQGFSHQTVWLSFIKYHAASTDPNAYHLSNECNARLRIWDKVMSPKTKKAKTVLLGEFCKEQELPRLCDHALLGNETRHVRPCTAKESYTSSADELTVEIFLKQGSVLFPLQFLLRYEFVDQSVEQLQLSVPATAVCDRTFTSGAGPFGSPKNVFFYGRGGRRNLTCVFRFEPANPNERVRITVSRMHADAAGQAGCSTETDARTDRMCCAYATKDGAGSGTGVRALLTVSHYPWPDLELPVGCACSNPRKPHVIESYPGAAVRVEFTVHDMNVTQDHRDFGFAAEYAFVKMPNHVVTDACRSLSKDRRLRGPGGVIQLDAGVVNGVDRRNCTEFPWLLEPSAESGVSWPRRTGGYVFLKLRGYEIPSHRWQTNSFMCATRNRVIVYSGVGQKSAKVICPFDLGTDHQLRSSFETFSPGWTETLTDAQQLRTDSRSVAVEFLEREIGSYAVTWMEVSKMPRIMPSTNVHAMPSNVHPECAYKCPELNACISSKFWCDGVPHCPMGFDEDPANCAISSGIVNLTYVGVLGASALVLFTLTLLAAVACLKYRAKRSRRTDDGGGRRRRSAQKSGDPMAVAADRLHGNKLTFLDQNGGGMNKRYPSSSDDLYLECKDSVC